MGRDTGGGRGGLRRNGDARTHRANTHLRKVICLYLLARDAMERVALETARPASGLFRYLCLELHSLASPEVPKSMRQSTSLMLVSVTNFWGDLL